VQPTDFRVRSVFVFLSDTEAARRNERGYGKGLQGLVSLGTAEDRPMKDRLMRLLAALSAVAALALAGGASLRGF
jgi:hypothetical protein